MSPHTEIASESGRVFATFPAAVLAFIVNANEEFLLLRCTRKGGWQVPSGALESGESPVEALERELREELGTEFRHRLLGPVDVSSFQWDEKISLLSISFLVEYLGGAVTPGDDMVGAEVAWMPLETITPHIPIAVPQNISHFTRALQLFRQLHGDR